eukprot:1055745-Pyramimonas_sp.AAC.1
MELPLYAKIVISTNSNNEFFRELEETMVRSGCDTDASFVEVRAGALLGFSGFGCQWMVTPLYREPPSHGTWHPGRCHHLTIRFYHEI